MAIERGPLVYCLEESGQLADLDVLDALVDTSAPLEAAWQPDLLGTLGGGGAVTARGAVLEDLAAWGETTFRPLGHRAATAARPVPLRATPYFAWANHGPSSMRVWIPRAGPNPA